MLAAFSGENFLFLTELGKDWKLAIDFVKIMTFFLGGFFTRGFDFVLSFAVMTPFINPSLGH